MRKTTKRPRKSSRRPGKPGKSESKATKRRTILTLDPDVVAGGEKYGKQHGTNLSQLVNGFLRALLARRVAEDDSGFVATLTPTVRRLYGVAAGGKTDRAAHREHLVEKYGSRS